MFSSEPDPEEDVALYETAFHMFGRNPTERDTILLREH